ncbi:MAG: SpoIID/LytB domain-containing protein, partial [Ruthenibacterium sp.]
SGTWLSENGKRYYLKPDGTKATGKQLIDDLYYVFDETGAVLRYEFFYEGCWYLTDENGALYRNCFLSRKGSRTFYNADGAAATGWIDALDGKQYYQQANDGGSYALAMGVVAIADASGSKKSYLFDKNGVRNTGSGWVDGVHLNEGIVSTGKQTFDGKTYIIKEDGTPNTGEFTYGGTSYFADANGVVCMDAFRTMEDGTLRYYNADGQAKAGWVRRSDGDYYQSAKLVILTGRQGIDGKTYFFGSDGRLSTTDGWAGDYYVKAGTALTGMQKLEGKTYYFGTDGLRVRGAFTLDGAKYSGDENGALYQNAVAYEANGAGTYYGADGKAVPGWVELSGVKYYQLDTLLLAVGKQTIAGETYFFMADGKQQTGDGWADLYYVKNGRVVTGPQTIDGARYIFGSDGIVYKGEFMYNNGGYCADETGKLYTEVIRTLANGKLRYCGADGKAPTKWIDTPDGSRYYQLDTLTLATGSTVIGGKTYYFDDTGRLIKAGWVGSYYVKDGLVVTGPQIIDGKKYIFSELGIAYKYVFTYEKLRYYASGTGVLYTNCFLTTGGKTTYYDETGAAHTGWITRANGAKYYQTTDYVLLTGQQTIDKVVYFFGTDGKLSTTDGWAGDYYVKGGAAVTGLQTIDGAKYIFGADGILQRGELVWQNDTYYADAKGVVQCDIVRTREDGTLRYYDADGKAVTAGWFQRGTDEYYQDKDMVLAVGKRTIDGKLCFFEADGKRKTTDGWAGDYYVKAGVALTGMQENLEGGTYVFSDEGVVYKGDFTWDNAVYYGDPVTGAVLRDGIHAVADGSGSRYHGKDGKAMANVWVELDGAKYYQTDRLLLATGKQTLGDATYYFETNGKLKTGTGWADGYYLVDSKVLTGGPHTLEGKLYLFGDADGLVQKDNFQYKGVWYCADETGALFTEVIRTLPDGRLRYLDQTGAAKPGFIDHTDGSTYYQGADGCLVTGQQTIDGKVYYFGDDGKKQSDGWVDGHYLKDGKPVTGRQVIDGKTYLFDANGLVQKGEFVYEGAAYGADEAGVLYLDAVLTRADGSKAYYGADGTAPTGWADSPSGAKYYQSVTNGVYTLANGIVPIGSEMYYFLSSGRLFSSPSGWYIVNGKQCYLLADGRYCTPPAIKAVNTLYDAAKKLYSITIDSSISTAAGVNAGGSFSFDGGRTWQTSNVMTVPADKGITLGAGKIRVRDGVGQVIQYTQTVYLAPVVVIPGGSGNSGPGSYGIDVSQYNGVINWPAVKASGIRFAIIRATSCNNSGYYVDPYFESNVRNAKAAGIDVGLYIFSYARSYGDVNDEINFFLNSAQVKNLKASGITLDYPVYIDYESNLNLEGTSYDQRTDFVRQGMIQLRNAGYYPGFYTYHSYCNYFNVAQLVGEGYDFWYARYPLAPNPPSNPSGSIGANVSIWQYCSDGNTNPAMQPHVNGIYTSLDLNYVYDDVPTRVHKFYGTGSSTTLPNAPDGTVTQDMLTVYDTSSGRIVTDTAANILAKIVQTEVGGFNNAEVYKAQAIAAHSYIMYQSQSGTTPSVSLSAPSSAVTSAVSEVAGKIVTYNGTVANTMYGAANSGKTQSTEAMWGGAYPYLVAGIDSPGDLSATVYANGGHTWQNYSNTIKLSRMISNIEQMLPGSTNGRSDYENWITNPEYDANGYLNYITVMGTRIRAGKFYDNCWGLYSPNFNMSYNGNGTWTFVTRGNGHGVGMSQWGAWGYAKQGWGYDAILKYYYPGTAITSMG